MTMIGFWVIYFLAFTFVEPKAYNHYVLFQTVPENVEHIKYLMEISEEYDINFWRPPSTPQKHVEFTVSPEDKHAVLRGASNVKLNLAILMDDVQSVFNESVTSKYSFRKARTFNWDAYYRLDDIYNWLSDLASTHATIMSVRSIGETFEHRDILRAKVVLNPAATKRIIIEGGIHAREWISPAVVTYILNQVIHVNQSDNPKFTKFAHEYKWYFIPVANPDGYDYSHTKDRLWLKNRDLKGSGIGVNLNMNFDHQFKSGTGTSTKPNSDKYRGPEAFSEAESSAISRLVKCKSEGLGVYLSFHSYGQYVIIPYGHTKEHLDNYDDVLQHVRPSLEALEKQNRPKYEIGNAYETLGYEMSGMSADWVKREYKVPVVLTIMLPDNGAYGFALPSSEIEGACQDIFTVVADVLEPLLNPDERRARAQMEALSSLGCRVAHSDFTVYVMFLFNLLFFAIVQF